MKILFCLLFVLLSACASTPKEDPDRFNENFVVQEIAPGSYLVTDKLFYDSNVLVTKMKDGSVFISSSPYDTQGGRELIKWIRENLAPTKITAVNTHFHSDGTGSNGAFIEAGVEIWANELTDKLFKERAESLKAADLKDFADRPELMRRIEKRVIAFAPNRFPAKEGKTFDFGGEKVMLVYPGAAHSPDNTAVYFPDRKILFGTCMIRSGDSLGFLGNADVKAWPTSAANVQNLGAKIVIPGHGPIGGPELIAKTISLAKAAANAKP